MSMDIGKKKELIAKIDRTGFDRLEPATVLDPFG
jgi:hypothetical protein